MKKINSILIILIFGLTQAQQRVSLDEIIQIATESNFQNSLNDVQIRKAELERDGAIEIPKTGVFIENEDFQTVTPFENGLFTITTLNTELESNSGLLEDFQNINNIPVIHISKIL